MAGLRPVVMEDTDCVKFERSMSNDGALGNRFKQRRRTDTASSTSRHGNRVVSSAE